MMSAVGESMGPERFDGYTAFLRKPFRIAALIETVQRVSQERGDIDADVDVGRRLAAGQVCVAADVPAPRRAISSCGFQIRIRRDAA